MTTEDWVTLYAAVACALALAILEHKTEANRIKASDWLVVPLFSLLWLPVLVVVAFIIIIDWK